jgi:hypothetical protein
MIPAKNIAFASLTTPLFVCVPWLFLGAFFLAYQENEFRLDEYIPIALTFGASIYVPLAAASAVISIFLKRFGCLSKNSLLVVGVVCSIAFSAVVACSELSELRITDVALNFALYIAVTLVFFSAFFYAWWRLASNLSLQRASCAGR